MPGGVLTELPHTGSENEPDEVAALKRFKASLLRGKPAKASEFKSLPHIRSAPSRSLRAEIDSDDELSDEERESMEFDTEEQPDAAPVREVRREPAKDPLSAIADYLEQTPAREDIKIIGEFGRLSFKATNVSINEYGVAFIIKKDSFQFEPNINTPLKVMYKEQTYNVIYAGGFFTFPRIPFTFVSFLRITEDT